MERAKRIDSFMSKIFRVSCYVGGGVSCAMMILSVINVITRTLFKAPVFGAIELVSYASLVCGACAAAQNELDDGNATMTLILDNLKPRLRSLFYCICNVICAVFYGMLSYRFFVNIGDAIAKNELTQTLMIPMAVFYAVMGVGFVLLILTSLVKAMRRFYMVIGKPYIGEHGAPVEAKETPAEAGGEEGAQA